MQKRFSLWLWVLALVCAGLLPAYAAEEPTPDFLDSLILAYDFEGDTPSVQLQDKATAGQVRDDLKIIGSVTIADGIATTGSAHATDCLQAAGTADLQGLTGYTVYVKLKATGAYPDNWADFVNIPGVMRAFIDGKNGSNYSLQARHKGSFDFTYQHPEQYTVTEDSFFYVAYTARLEGGRIYEAAYVSHDGKDYLVGTMEKETSDSAFGASSTVNFGQNTQNGIRYSFDDILIFNRALTSDEIGQLSAARLEARQEPEVSDEDTKTEAPTSETSGQPAEPQSAEPTQAPEQGSEMLPAPTGTDEPVTGDGEGCASALTAPFACAFAVTGAGTLLLRRRKGVRK